ncbi:MAG: hypothetical protein ACHBNF_08325 [Chromatiales bacterium]
MAFCGLSITLVPVLMTIFIRGKRLKPESQNPVSRFFTWLYDPIIRLALRWKWTALLINFAVVPLTIPLLFISAASLCRRSTRGQCSVGVAHHSKSGLLG